MNQKFLLTCRALFFSLLTLLSYGVKAGDNRSIYAGALFSPNVNWAKPSKGPALANGTSFGYSWGGMMDLNLVKKSNNFFLSVEFLSTMLYSKIQLKGEDMKFVRQVTKIPYTEVNYTHKINYLDIPITLKLKMNEIGYTTYFLQLGINPGILYATKAKWEGTVFGMGETTTVDYYPNNSKDENKNQFNEFEDNTRFMRFSSIIGAGAEYRFSGNTVVMGSLRFNNGLSNYLNDKTEPNIRARNSFVSLQIGLLF
jgi:hypothetical protein